jgi:8-oxo-dGTP pyrophosphatase MutT (NUDIX family)
MPIPPSEGVRPWERVSSKDGPDLIVFRSRFDRMTHPKTGEELDRLVLKSTDWVNVVALTSDQRLIVVRQYRFGTEEITTEVPGGMIDAGEGHEESARRELLEETGYVSDNWTYLGNVDPNPAVQTNQMHHWLARDCRLEAEQELDAGEDIEVATLSEDELRGAVSSGEIRHALVLTALHRVFDLRDELGANA